MPNQHDNRVIVGTYAISNTLSNDLLQKFKSEEIPRFLVLVTTPIMEALLGNESSEINPLTPKLKKVIMSSVVEKCINSDVDFPNQIPIMDEMVDNIAKSLYELYKFKDNILKIETNKGKTFFDPAFNGDYLLEVVLSDIHPMNKCELYHQYLTSLWKWKDQDRGETEFEMGMISEADIRKIVGLISDNLPELPTIDIKVFTNDGEDIAGELGLEHSREDINSYLRQFVDQAIDTLSIEYIPNHEPSEPSVPRKKNRRGHR